MTYYVALCIRASKQCTELATVFTYVYLYTQLHAWPLAIVGIGIALRLHVPLSQSALQLHWQTNIRTYPFTANVNCAFKIAMNVHTVHRPLLLPGYNRRANHSC